LIVPKTKEELAYDNLKDLILSGELPKNEFLSQRMLARLAKTNITTVRTALRQIENDGLIENVPQWGVRIPIETEERLRDLYFMRELLEVGAVRCIRQRRQSVDLDTIRKKAKHCDALARKLPKNILEFSQSHFDFHMELAHQSGSDLLVQSLKGIHFRRWLVRHDLWLWERRDVINHEKLVDSIFGTTEASAVSAMRQHVTAGMDRELEELRKATTKLAADAAE
jgi:DNA-binding GntR family transcriptional regulator